MVYLQNDKIKVEISEIGAEIMSAVSKDGKEHIWNGDPKFWHGHCPVLFPICGRLRDNIYTYTGKEYSLGSHGFARKLPFEVNKVSDEDVIFTLKANENTKKVYPFDFEFVVEYKLENASIDATYTAKNVGENDMYFSFGGHEGYMCEGGIEDYYIEFDKNVTLDSYTVEGPIINHEITRILDNSNKLPLKNEYFKIDALVFRDIDFDALTIKKNDGSFHARVEFPGFKHLLLWMVPGAPYICVEPWCGFPDYTDSDQVFEHKIGINKIAKGEEFTRTHKLIF